MIGQDMGEGGEFNEEKDENGPRLTKKKEDPFQILLVSIYPCYLLGKSFTPPRWESLMASNL